MLEQDNNRGIGCFTDRRHLCSMFILAAILVAQKNNHWRGHRNHGEVSLSTLCPIHTHIKHASKRRYINRPKQASINHLFDEFSDRGTVDVANKIFSRTVIVQTPHGRAPDSLVQVEDLTAERD